MLMLMLLLMLLLKNDGLGGRTDGDCIVGVEDFQSTASHPMVTYLLRYLLITRMLFLRLYY